MGRIGYMSGANLVLKENQTLFKEGDTSDGMYLVRRGEVCVYLIKDNNEVKLATIGAGGMIGEMAFFDKKPRSASVKAVANSEVTKISEEDFAKLLKQVPKWLVSIMTSLSTRLRDTNDRLQKLENKLAGINSPIEDTIRILHVLTLIWHKEGTKDEKKSLLNKENAEKKIQEMFGLKPEFVNKLFDALIKQKFFQVSLDNYKNQLLSTANRGSLATLANFLREFSKEFGGVKSLPKEAIEMLETLIVITKKTAYEKTAFSIEDLVVEGNLASLDTTAWSSYLAFFKRPTEAITLTKTEKGLGIKTNKDELPKLVELHKILYSLVQSGII